MAKVTIIIPVYNAEETIERCINSIIRQSFKDYQILAINDGSTDNSLRLLKKLQSKYYDKLKVVDQENQGVSVTRNRAIKLAKSKYIMFVDNDDYLDSDYLATYVSEIETGDYNVVIGGYRRITEENKILEQRVPNNHEWGKLIIVTPWAKIYRRDFIVNNDITFLDYSIGEDVYFNLLLLSKTDKIKIIKYIGYNWFYNTKSITNTIHKSYNSNVDILFLVKSIQENVEPNNYISNNTLSYFYVRLILYYLLFSGSSASSNSFMEQYEYLKGYLITNIPSYQKLVMFHMPRGETFKVKIILKVFIVIEKLRLVPLFAKFYCRGNY